jgi:Ca-activated chloride channel family protein
MNPNEQDWKILISAYVDGALSPDDAAAAERLLAEKPECQAYLAELRRLALSLHVLKDETLSPDAERKILTNTTKERSMKTNYWKTSAAVAASLLIVVLAYNNLKTSIPGEITPKGVIVQVPIPAPGSQPVTVVTPSTPTPQPVNMFMAAKQVVGNALGKTQGALNQAAAPMMEEKRAEIVSYGGNKTNTLQYEPYYSNGFQGRPAVIPDGGGEYWGTDERRNAAYGAGSERSRIESYVYTNAYDRSFMNQPVGFNQYAQYAGSNTEEYAKVEENKFLTAADNPLSTFSIDVDTASYSNIRRYLTNNQLPPKDAARIEEMVNYFSYDYPQPKDGEPFSVTTNLAVCPWNKAHQLLRIGLKGKTPDASKLPPSNLVFLIDVSGSMQDANKLPLLKEGFKMMVRQLRPEDKVSIAVYAGNAGKILEPTSGADKDKILWAIDQLQAGGSTAGGEGILLAYQLAKDSFIKGGNNRVILATDGDFNVGVSNTGDLTRIIEEKRKDGIFLTILGFGEGNIKDSRLVQLADKGNGNYYYIDNSKEAKKVLVTELGSTLFTIAKDVKVQIEFNPAQVKAYRLIGYEKRMLAKEDFNNDQKDAGEIGAGHTVTALYEVVPASSTESFGNVDNLKYQEKVQPVVSNEVMTVKLRYKEPDKDVSKLITQAITKSDIKDEPTGDFAFASAVAEFGMLLRGSEFKADSSYDHVKKTAKASLGDDKFGFRAEFVTLVETAETLDNSGSGNIQFK